MEQKHKTCRLSIWVQLLKSSSWRIWQFQVTVVSPWHPCPLVRTTGHWSRRMKKWGRAHLTSLPLDFLNRLPTSSSPWRLSQMATFTSWKLTYTEDQMAPSDTLHTGNHPTLTSVWMLSHTTIQWISILCYPPTLAQRARAICDMRISQDNDVFRQNGYSDRSFMLSVCLRRW
jgi:hypothetical protein